MMAAPLQVARDFSTFPIQVLFLSGCPQAAGAIKEEHAVGAIARMIRTCGYRQAFIQVQYELNSRKDEVRQIIDNGDWDIIIFYAHMDLKDDTIGLGKNKDDNSEAHLTIEELSSWLGRYNMYRPSRLKMILFIGCCSHNIAESVQAKLAPSNKVFTVGTNAEINADREGYPFIAQWLYDIIQGARDVDKLFKSASEHSNRMQLFPPRIGTSEPRLFEFAVGTSSNVRKPDDRQVVNFAHQPAPQYNAWLQTQSSHAAATASNASNVVVNFSVNTRAEPLATVAGKSST
jgi:hypothetical protein